MTWLDYTHTWSISAVASIAWVIIAYIFTVIDSFTGDITQALNSSGGVGSLWLWLLPIVIGWLQISPKCDYVRLGKAIERANIIAYIASPSGPPVLASSMSEQHAVERPLSVDVVRLDERCTVPIYNYARFLPWSKAVEDVASIFSAASARAHAHISVDPMVEWEVDEKSAVVRANNRRGTLAQVDGYCVSLGESVSESVQRGRWVHDTWSRFLVASIFALSLQWGTVGAAIVLVWFTPTTSM